MADEQQAKPVAPEIVDIEAINRELDAANKKLVSDEVAKLIASEKDKARQEAEKEFLINQKLKEKEAEIEKMKQAQLEKERAAAEQLEALRRKVDELAASKQSIPLQNPFAANGSATASQAPSNDTLRIVNEDLDAVERASFEALLNRRTSDN